MTTPSNSMGPSFSLRLNAAVFIMAKPVSLCPDHICVAPLSSAAVMPTNQYFSPFMMAVRLSRFEVSLFLNIIGRPSGVTLPEMMNDVQAAASVSVRSRAARRAVYFFIFGLVYSFYKDNKKRRYLLCVIMKKVKFVKILI